MCYLFTALQPPPTAPQPISLTDHPVPRVTQSQTELSVELEGKVLAKVAENVAAQTGLSKSDVSPCAGPNPPSLPPADPQSWGKEVAH